MALLNCRPYSNITSLNCGAWPRAGRIAMVKQFCGDWSCVYEESLPQTEKVNDLSIEAKTIPQLIEILGVDSVDFLKVDVEGSEKILFEDPSSVSWIPRCRLISCETHDSFQPGCSQAVYKSTSSAGFIHSQHGEFDYFINPNSRV